ncbi:hypothetical protein ACIQWR_39080 [Streptomyces sp. NPDC098789]|uniref:hypothetical protein n=1 Tax=Streptomyces sp. NPDC098789 TaxID=3366098 RepID=UPI003825E4C7
MTSNSLHGDLCPLCSLPLTLRTTAVVRSANTAYPIRINTVPHCTSCTSDMTRAQQWADKMRDRYEN